MNKAYKLQLFYTRQDMYVEADRRLLPSISH